ncbi:N-lysine methyltransferase KMT5A-B-like [Ruditapes philippinarum]|uniref:N-lysine methyltransferase KMT5A-B-like n=1 Tax=Ruditapes philippinarum TaxID=129788 RepID=UPI00295AAC1D|nr:N-lysine methyltransferase KMT5A-B-like [Ruditapes philippinarum]
MRKRSKPENIAMEWILRQDDPPGFRIEKFPDKGRGVVTTTRRQQGEFLLVYRGETISEEEGERREKDGGSGYRFFFKFKGKTICIDATAETSMLGRLVNHGSKRERNCKMKEVNGHLCLFAISDILEEEELLYDYGLTELPWEKQKMNVKVQEKLKGESNYKRGSDCIRRTVNSCHLQCPERITSTKLRKYLATVSQVRYNLRHCVDL